MITDPKDLVNLETTPFSSCDEKAPNGILKADVYGDSVNYIFHWFHRKMMFHRKVMINGGYSSLRDRVGASM